MNDLDEWIKQAIAVYVKDDGVPTAGQIKEVMASWVNHADSSPYGDYITTTDAGIDNTITVCTNPNNVPRINNWEKFKTAIDANSTGYGIAFYEQYHSSPNQYMYQLRVYDDTNRCRYEITIKFNHTYDSWVAMSQSSSDIVHIPNDRMVHPSLLWTYLKDSFKIP